MFKGKIFGIGLPKTATTSLSENGNFLTNNEPSDSFSDCWKPSYPFNL